MNWRTVICLVVIGLLAIGCGKKNSIVVKEGDYEQYFREKRPYPTDSSLRLSVLATVPRYPSSGPVELSLVIENMSERALSLPIGLESNQGFSYTYFSALVRDETGSIKHATFPADEGDLVSAELDPHGFTTEFVPLDKIYDFLPGTYEVVLFYSVGEGTLPNGEKPDWTGKLWSSPITVEIE